MSAPMSPTLLSLFAEVPDPRRGQGKMYPLAPILLFTVLAMLSGAVSSEATANESMVKRDLIIFLESKN